MNMHETETGLKEELAEIAERYEEKNYFRRLREMMSGLRRPRDTPEYKKARTELQRQAAPLVAVASVAMLVVTLIVVTALQPDNTEKFKIDVQQEDPPVEPDKDQDPDPIPPPDVDPDPADIDIPLDVPNPGDVSELTPMPSPPTTSDNVSAKPATEDAVAHVPSPVKFRNVYASRTPGTIGKATGGGNQYGDKTTEAAVLKVLWYLKAHQRSDGSWSRREGTTGSVVSDTALALLTFLAHGEYEGNADSPYRKDFGPAVSAGIQFLVNSFEEGKNPLDSRIKGCDGNEYAFLIATYALCEAYGMTRNPACKEVASKALERIIRGQSPTGGWDYKINPQSKRDDMSFAGWALQALKAGKMAGLHPDGLQEAIQKAVRCLKSRNFRNDHFTYTAESGGHVGLTATGCLAMQLLGFSGEGEVRKSLDYMREWRPAFRKEDTKIQHNNDATSPQYYCYYATQCKYQAGMRAGATKADELAWQAWNRSMKALYPSSITDVAEKVRDWNGGEHRQGYYLECSTDNYRNDIMSSCFVALQLMVYYRYLPTTQTSASADAGPAAGAIVAGIEKDDVKIEMEGI